jgi:hypothetical protein
MIRVVYPRSCFFTHPGSQIQGSTQGTESRIRIHNTASRKNLLPNKSMADTNMDPIPLFSSAAFVMPKKTRFFILFIVYVGSGTFYYTFKGFYLMKHRNLQIGIY